MLIDVKLKYFRKRGLVYLTKGDYKKAVKCFSKVLQNSTSAPDKYNLGIAYLGTNKYKEAIDCFKAVQEQEPNNELNLLSLGEAYLLSERWEKAVTTFNKLVDLNPNNLQYHKYLIIAQTPEKREKHIHCKRLLDQGDQEIRNKNFEAALERFEHALQLNKDSPYIYNSIGTIYLKYYKDVEKALTYFEKATKLAPRNRIFLENIERCQKRLR